MVIKRDGSKALFNENKIYEAIRKANKEVQNDFISDEEIATYVIPLVRQFKGEKERLLIEDIQDIVEFGIMKSGHYMVGKAYTLYRHKRQTQRALQANKIEDTIMSIIRNDNEELSAENSNKDFRTGATQRDYMAGIISTEITKNRLLSDRVLKAHEEGAIHFHDMDYAVQPLFNCCLPNMEDMLYNGSVMNGKLIEQPRTFRVACTVMTQFIACICSHQYGGQSVDLSVLGYFLSKSKEKIQATVSRHNLSALEKENLVSELLKDELSAGVQTMQYQINTLMTTNGQSPFVTLFLYLREGDPYLEENALIIEEVLKQRIKGIKNNSGEYVTPAFPKLVYVLDENNNLKGGRYDWVTRLAAQCTSKRMYPDYISAKKMKENYEGNVFSPMGCRSFLAPLKNEKGEYQFKGRFNQGAVSLNLPQVAILSKGNQAIFWSLLADRVEIVYEALMLRHKSLLGTTSDISPIHWQHGGIARLKPGELIDPFLKDGYSSISMGYIGVYEMTKIMTGQSHTTKEGLDFALSVMKFLRERTDTWKKNTGLGFGLYGTPAESLCYRFARIDAERFGIIKDVTDKGYYTNSYHVDVREEIDVFDKFIFESQFQPISSGGCISYAEIPNLVCNQEAICEVIKFIYDNIQYAEFNTKNDLCQVCGFTGEILVSDDNNWECPQCHCKDKNKMTVIRRTCGYLGENYWNKGKTKEIKSRVVHLN